MYKYIISTAHFQVNTTCIYLSKYFSYLQHCHCKVRKLSFCKLSHNTLLLFRNLLPKFPGYIFCGNTTEIKSNRSKHYFVYFQTLHFSKQEPVHYDQTTNKRNVIDTRVLFLLFSYNHLFL